MKLANCNYFWQFFEKRFEQAAVIVFLTDLDLISWLNLVRRLERFIDNDCAQFFVGDCMVHYQRGKVQEFHLRRLLDSLEDQQQQALVKNLEQQLG